METCGKIMMWTVGVVFLVPLVFITFFVAVPGLLKSGELTWKRLIWGGLALVAFVAFRMLYVDPYIPKWLDDVIGYW